jgi:hypothetical protein
MADFVSFRPGSLAAELAKRGKSTSLVAKLHLTRHFESLAEDRRTICNVFSKHEIRFVFVALHSTRNLTADNVVRSFNDGLAQQKSMQAIAAKYDIDVVPIDKKLKSLSFREAFALVDAVEQFREMDLSDVMAGFLPMPQVLQRIGVIAPDGPVAWGLCTVRLPDHFLELVLRPTLEDFGEVKEDDCTLDELVSILIEYADLQRDFEPVEGITNRAYRAAYAIARKKGFQHFCVLASDTKKAVEVREMEVNSLSRDMYEKSIVGLVLSGVNAP